MRLRAYLVYAALLWAVTAALIIGASYLTAEYLVVTQTSEREQTMKHLTKFLRDDSGATAIEYGLIAGLVAVASIGALGALGSEITGLFQGVADQLAIAGGGAP